MEQRDRDGHSNSLLLDIYQRLAVVEAQNAQILRGQNDAADSRNAIHAKLEDFGLIAATVRRLEPIVVELDRIRERAIGMQIMVKVFWLALGALAAGGGFLISYFTYGGKPH